MLLHELKCLEHAGYLRCSHYLVQSGTGHHVALLGLHGVAGGGADGGEEGVVLGDAFVEGSQGVGGGAEPGATAQRAVTDG